MAMLTGYRMRVVVAALLFGMGITTVAAEEPSEKLSHKTYDVQRLSDGDGSTELIDLIGKVIAPTTWDIVGGEGAIKEAKKGQLDVFQTAAVHKNVAELLEALGKLPSLQVAEDKQARKTTQGRSGSRSKKAVPSAKPVWQSIPAGNNAATGQSVVIYYWKASADEKNGTDFDSIIDKITSTVAPNTWNSVGGEGAIEPYPKGHAIVVRQSQEVHKQIAKMAKIAKKAT
jgi:hypothetical protein